MTQIWKLPHVLKGLLTWVPLFNAWRLRRASPGGTDSSRYCYSVWLRQLTMLDQCGFKINGARVGELGPGNSIGLGLAALISGANSYVGLDIMLFHAKVDLEKMFEELYEMYRKKQPIPDDVEFPSVRPKLG